MPFCLILAAALLGPVALYAAARPPAGRGSRAAPPVVRAAIGGSFLLGQVLVPGVFAALALAVVLYQRVLAGEPIALVLVLALAAPTGLVTAGLGLRAGLGLLRRAPARAAQARGAGRWALGHHAAFLGGLAAAWTLGAERTACAALGAFALASLAEGALLLGAARAVEQGR